MPVSQSPSKKPSKDGGDDRETLLSKLLASEQSKKDALRKVEKLEKKVRKASKSEGKENKQLKKKIEHLEEQLKKNKDELKTLKGKKGKKLKKELAEATEVNRRENKELKIQVDKLSKEAHENQKTIDHLRTVSKDTKKALAEYETYKTDEAGIDAKVANGIKKLRSAEELHREWEEEMKQKDSSSETAAQRAETRIQRAQGLLAEFQKTNSELRSHNGYLQRECKKLRERMGDVPTENARRLEQLEDWNHESRRLLAQRTRQIKDLSERLGVSHRLDDYDKGYNKMANALTMQLPLPRDEPASSRSRSDRTSIHGARGPHVERYDNDDDPAPRGAPNGTPGYSAPRERSDSHDDDSRYGYDPHKPQDAYAKYGVVRPTKRSENEPVVYGSKASAEPPHKQRERPSREPARESARREKPAEKPRSRGKTRRDRDSDEDYDRDRPARGKRYKKSRRRSDDSSDYSDSYSSDSSPRRRKRKARKDSSSRSRGSEHSEDSYDDIEIVDSTNPASYGTDPQKSDYVPPHKRGGTGAAAVQPKSILKKSPKIKPKPSPAEPEDTGVVEVNDVVKMWKKYMDPKGRPYYHDHVTGATQWTRPKDFRI